MSDVCRINVSVLKSYEKDFRNELTSFKHKTYATFSSSYLRNCSDTYVGRMYNELQTTYNKIKTGYENIDKWWIDYNNNIEGLENYLSDNGGIGSIPEASVRNSANRLPNLRKYNINFSGIILSGMLESNYNNLFVNNGVAPTIGKVGSFSPTGGVIQTAKNNINSFVDNANDWRDETNQKIDDWFNDVGTEISAKTNSWISDVIDWKSNLEKWWNAEALPWFDEAGAVVNDVLASVGATIGAITISLVEGLLQLGESILDAFVVTIGLLFTAGQWLYGLFGNEWKDENGQMWDAINGFVAKNYVSGWFDAFYETSFGQTIKNNAIFFDQVRTITSGVGYTAGIVVLSIATGGALPLISGIAGFGKTSENAWANGASNGEGLAVALLGAGLEAAQYALGAKVLSNVENIIGRVVLNGADAGIEGFIYPIFDLIYKEGYHDENGNYVEFSEDMNLWDRYSKVFEESGGFTNVLTKTAIGSGSTLLGEFLRNYYKNQALTSNNENVNPIANHNGGAVPEPSTLGEQIELANYNAQKGRFVVIKLDNLDDATAKELKNLSNPDALIEYNGKRYTTSQINDLFNSNTGRATSSVGITGGAVPKPSTLGEQIELANYNAKKGRFTVIKLDNLDDAAIKELKALYNPDALIEYNGKRYTPLQINDLFNSNTGRATSSVGINGGAVPKPTTLGEQIELANSGAPKDRFTVIKLDNLDNATIKELKNLSNQDALIEYNGKRYTTSQINDLLNNNTGKATSSVEIPGELTANSTTEPAEPSFLGKGLSAAKMIVSKAISALDGLGISDDDEAQDYILNKINASKIGSLGDSIYKTATSVGVNSGVESGLSSLGEQIAKANSNAQTGIFSVIKLDSLNESAIKELQKLKSFDNVHINYNGNSYKAVDFINALIGKY